MDEPEDVAQPSCGMPEFVLAVAWWGLWLAAGLWVCTRSAR